MIDLKGKCYIIFGLKGSGKTELAKYILSLHRNHYIYDTLHEYNKEKYTVYLPSHATTDKAIYELNLCINRDVLTKKPSLFHISEMNRYCPNRKPLPEAVAKLNDWNRHYNIAYGGDCRRPAQLNTDITELANYIFCFRLKGKNDCQYLDDTVKGLGDAVAELDDYHFIMVDEKRNLRMMQPIKMVK